MRQIYHLIILSWLFFSPCFFLGAQTPYGNEPLAHTYSIVAYDPATGEMGVAVQSHWFSVGTIVAWGEPGVGVVATQSFVNPALGPSGLSLLKAGFDAKAALKSEPPNLSLLAGLAQQQSSDGGPIVLAEDASIGPYCFLSGPAIVGQGAKLIEHAAIKDAVTVGHTTKIGGEVEASEIMPHNLTSEICMREKARAIAASSC